MHLLFRAMDVIDFILTLITKLLDLAKFVAEQLSQVTGGFVPANAVDEVALLILLLVIRFSHDYSKKILDILIVLISIYIFLLILPSILALF
jgi:hypothetical protein